MLLIGQDSDGQFKIPSKKPMSFNIMGFLLFI